MMEDIDLKKVNEVLHEANRKLENIIQRLYRKIGYLEDEIGGEEQ